MREAIFSSIGPAIHGARVLDLFAGTGAYGLEAISRGARETVWIESARGTASLLEKNRKDVEKSMGTRTTSRLLIRDIRRHGMRTGDRFDFIFADPPYHNAETLLPEVFLLAGQHLASSDDARLIIEAPGNLPLYDPLWEEVRRFGNEKSGPSLRVLTRKPTE